MAARFTIISFLWRLIFALILVLATYNPSGYSFVEWVRMGWDQYAVYKALVGILLLIGWTVYCRATWRSLGAIGMLLASALFGVIIWMFYEWGLFSSHSLTILTWLVATALAFVLATGMSWSHIRRRLSGQLDVDDADE